MEKWLIKLSIPMMVTPRTDDGNPPKEEPINERAFCEDYEDTI